MDPAGETEKRRTELREVIDIFLSKSTLPETLRPAKPLRFKFISFFYPFEERESLLLNLVLPGSLASYVRSCFLVTGRMGREHSEMVRAYLDYAGGKPDPASGLGIPDASARSRFSWIVWPDQRWDARGPVSLTGADRREEPGMPLEGALVVLDLFRSTFLEYKHLICLLDQLVLVLKPDIEGLKKGYKVIKACTELNRDLGTSVIFDGSVSMESMEKIFSRWSALVSEYLAVSVRCLGAVPFSFAASRPVEEIRAEQLMLSRLADWMPNKPQAQPMSLEQIQFLQRLETWMDQEVG